MADWLRGTPEPDVRAPGAFTGYLRRPFAGESLPDTPAYRSAACDITPRPKNSRNQALPPAGQVCPAL